jgi:NitT/TauT family transport system substrate-binding protein
MKRRTLLASLPALAFPIMARAATITPVKFLLNWKYQGPQGWFFLAEDRGYYAANGIAITLDQSEGSAAPIAQVAGGAYDAGFGDINALIALAASHPDEAPIAVYTMYDVPPFCIAVKADSPIRTPKDLEGKTLGAPASDGAFKLWPAFAQIAGVDASKVSMQNIAPNLREQMLIRGQVDGVFGYVNTIRFSAMGAGIADKDIRYIRYGDYGMDLYSNTVIVSRKLARDKPDIVRGLVQAINHGLVDSLKDPSAAIASVMKREPLLNEKVERARFDATLADEMNGAELGQIGIGDMNDERLRHAIAINVKAYGLPRAPAISEIFTRAFLPPLSERPKKLFV